MEYIAIMAGGVGSRFWPKSREMRPKQFLDMLGTGSSLLQLTYQRSLKIVPREHIYIVTNAAYKDLVLEQLPELSESQVLCEPSRNNTAPCIAYISYKLKQLDENATFVVAPSDHIILKEDVFVEKIKTALRFAAENDALLTLGIQPTRPDTGYGYIKFEKESRDGVHKVAAFTEKPDLVHAKEFVASGEYLWNGGIFIWSAKAVTKAFEAFSPELHKLFYENRDILNTVNEQNFINQHYPKTPNISVDYAIMEKAPNIYTLPADIGWSDLGSWSSVHIEMPKNDEGNAVFQEDAVLYDTHNCLISAPPGKLVVVSDLHNYIIVDEGDVLMIMPMHKEQEVKKVVSDVKDQLGEKFL